VCLKQFVGQEHVLSSKYSIFCQSTPFLEKKREKIMACDKKINLFRKSEIQKNKNIKFLANIYKTT